MAKATYKRKHCIGGFLTVSEGEYMIIKAGRHGTGLVTESLCPNWCKLKAKRQSKHDVSFWHFKVRSPHHNTSPPRKLNLLILPQIAFMCIVCLLSILDFVQSVLFLFEGRRQWAEEVWKGGRRVVLRGGKELRVLLALKCVKEKWGGEGKEADSSKSSKVGDSTHLSQRRGRDVGEYHYFFILG